MFRVGQLVEWSVWSNRVVNMSGAQSGTQDILWEPSDRIWSLDLFTWVWAEKVPESVVSHAYQSLHHGPVCSVRFGSPHWVD